jgi:hypothetical protein
VAVRSGDRTVLLVLCGAVCAVVLAGVLAVSAAVSPRAGVYAQLQRPASVMRATVGPGPVVARVEARPYRVRVMAAPNRASRHNRLSVVITRDGRPVEAARVSVTYSMNAMNMRNVFTDALAHTASGTYSATQPVFGMAGVWDLRFEVTPAHGAPVTVAVSDRMRG